MMTKKEAAEAVRAAKARLKVTWAQLAEAADRPLALDVARAPDPAGDRVTASFARADSGSARLRCSACSSSGRPVTGQPASAAGQLRR